MENDSLDRLIEAGFVQQSIWVSSGTGIQYQHGQPGTWLEATHALYAFCVAGTVCYIGKTSRSLRSRFAGYQSPGNGQQTNLRVNQKIREALSNQQEVTLYTWVPEPGLQWASYDIDLAAGLENSLIAAFEPEWNRAGRKLRSESDFNEEVASPSEGPDPAAAPSLGAFSLHLADTYYNLGYLNPGVEASEHLGHHGDPVILQLGLDGPLVPAKIDRNANRNNSVRIYGGMTLARWFQNHFSPGGLVEAEILHTSFILIKGANA